MIARFFIIALTVPMLGMQAGFFRTQSTAHFRIRYEKGLDPALVRKLGGELERAYAGVQERIGVTPGRPITAFVYKSLMKYRSDSKSVVFDDGTASRGQVYVVVPKAGAGDMKFAGTILRIVTRAMLDEIQAAPPWLRECYSLYAGGDLARFGQPAGTKVSDFNDLSEEYSGAERRKETIEVYAKLAVTADFLVNRYGEKKLERMFREFNAGSSMEEIFRNTLGENMADAERAWLQDLKNRPRE